MGLSIVILAAGAGSRMRSKTPKVLHKIAGKEMIFYILREAKKLSDDIKVVLFHDRDRIKEAIESSFENIEFITQDHKNYPGTGGALRGIEYRYENVLILNGDMPLITASSLEEFVKTKEEFVLSVISVDPPNSYGKVVIKDDKVVRIVEQKDATKEIENLKSVNGGVYYLKREFLDKYIPKLKNNNAQKEYYLTDVVEMAIKDKIVVTPLFLPHEIYRGVNSKGDLSVAEEIMLKRVRAKWQDSGVSMRMPETIYIEDGVRFEGECYLENSTSFYGDSIIKESTIKCGTTIEDAKISNSTLGPYARVRGGCEIEDSTIGNFVETKKALLKGVKAGHLSYLGDCEIGARTNIGAGTITCNYDGKSKYKTIIGKDVFVGSDTQFVAPVNIEDRVIIAAGTTVTKDAKSGSLVISRGKDREIEGFYDSFFRSNSLES